MLANPYEAPHGRAQPERPRNLSWLYYLPFSLAIACYCAALFTAGGLLAEILSDVGNAILLSTAVLILIRLHALSARWADGPAGGAVFGERSAS